MAAAVEAWPLHGRDERVPLKITQAARTRTTVMT